MFFINSHFEQLIVTNENSSVVFFLSSINATEARRDQSERVYKKLCGNTSVLLVDRSVYSWTYKPVCQRLFSKPTLQHRETNCQNGFVHKKKKIPLCITFAKLTRVDRSLRICCRQCFRVIIKLSQIQHLTKLCNFAKGVWYCLPW